jgi:uncharacterized protein YoxC
MQIILFIAFIVLIFILSGYVKKLILKTDQLHEDINNFKTKLDPLIDDTIELVKKINNISDKVEDNIDVLRKATDKVKTLVDDVVEFKDKIQNKIEPPINDTIQFYIALVKGIKAFSGKIKNYYPSKKSSNDNLLFDVEEKIDYDSEIKEEYNDINKELNEVRKKLEEMKKV